MGKYHLLSRQQPSHLHIICPEDMSGVLLMSVREGFAFALGHDMSGMRLSPSRSQTIGETSRLSCKDMVSKTALVRDCLVV
jgi:hypothetical protein